MFCFSTGRKKRRPRRTAKRNKLSPGPIRAPDFFVQDRRCLVGGGVLDAAWAAAIFWVLRRPQTPCRGGACPSRRNDCDSYRASTKRCAPIASVRFYQQPVRTASAFPKLHSKGTSSRFALRAPRQGSASCISALSYNILSKKSKIAINPDFSGPISPFRLLSQKKSVMMEGRICNCIFHGRFCRCPALFPVHNAAASG